MRKLIIATKNKGKVKEIKKLLQGYDYEIITQEEAGFDIDVEENGVTFEENSIIKARTLQKLTGEMVIADDSGIEIDFLRDAPGVYSARFLGNVSDENRCKGVLKLLEGVPDEFRTARFKCAASLVTDKDEITFFGTLEGKIAFTPKGNNGFGYDPILYIPKYEKTVAQLDEDLKNRISHRGKAFELLAEKLKNWSNP